MDGKQFEFKLIEAVEHHQCIYNKALKSYRNKLLKEKAWGDVAVCVGAEIKQCQDRWRSLRDRFVKETVKRPKSGSGAAEEDSEWAYYQALSFLRIHVAPRGTFSNTQLGTCFEADSSQSSLSTEPTDESLEPPLSAGELFQTPESPLAEEKYSRLDNLIDSVSDMISVGHSRNAGYYTVLESYLRQLSEVEQDTLKCAFLRQANEKIVQLKN